MIKILEENPAPRDTIRCSNCNSLLDYGNADLSLNYDKMHHQYCSPLIKYYYLTCPVCGCKIDANWIIKSS